TLEAKSGPGIREEIYWFKDKAGRNLGLRFALTVGMTRMIANRFDLPEPIKIGCIGGVWRYDEPQYARYRYHTQWDAEIYGVAEPTADAEIISLGSDILDKVGLKDHEVRVSNRKLAEGFLQTIGVRSQEELERLLRIIDGMGKKGPEQIEGELGRAGLSQDKVKRVMGFADIGGDADKVLPDLEKKLPKNDLISKGLQELTGTIDNVDSLGKRSKVQVDLRIVRGISYYAGEDVRDETIKVMRALRDSGLRADRDLKERPLKKQMDYAASAKVRIIVIVGPRELKEGNVRLRDMKTGEERNVPKNRVVEEMAKILA